MNIGTYRLKTFLPTTFTAYESYLYTYDKKVSPLLKNYLHIYSKDEEEFDFMVDESINKWCVCELAKRSYGELEYFEKTYPYTYERMEEDMDEIMKNSNDTQKQIESSLLNLDFLFDEKNVKDECIQYYNKKDRIKN